MADRIEATGVVERFDKNVVSWIETGRRNIKGEELFAMARTFQLPVCGFCIPSAGLAERLLRLADQAVPAYHLIVEVLQSRPPNHDIRTFTYTLIGDIYRLNPGSEVIVLRPTLRRLDAVGRPPQRKIQKTRSEA